MEKSWRKYAPKASPRPLFNSGKFLKQPLRARNYYKNKIFWKRITKKTLKKSTLFFLPDPVLFNGQSYQKQKGSETSDQSLFRSQNKFRKTPLFVLYYLAKFDNVM